MKIVIPFFFLCFYSLCALGQSTKPKETVLSKQQLIGVWQAKSSIVGDALQKTIQFFANDSFVINYTQYDDISRLRNIGGHYKLDSSGIYLSAEYRIEIVGGTYETGNPGIQSEEFILTGGKLTVIKQKIDPDSYTDVTPLSPYEDKSTSTSKSVCMSLNYNIYYKLSNNPMTYKKK